MRIINKICFLINWGREIDMFKNIYNQFDKEKIFFLINDLNKKIQDQEKEKIIKIFEKDNFNYDYLSNILNKKSFKILLSTADLPASRLTIKSILKFLYGKTIGTLIELLGIHYYLKKFFKREYIAEGKNASIYEDFFIEKKISETTIKFPNGLDRNIKYFPNDKWLNIFDIFLTTSTIESELIEKKFKSKKIFQIGYPRFFDKQIKRENLKEEFFINSKLKTIFCCPNERIVFEQNEDTIIKYIQTLKLLEKKYNVILRPHPKLQFTNPKYFLTFKNSGLNVDLKMNRSIHDLFSISDLIIVDYGSSVLEALYLKKKILVYEWSNEKKFKILFDKKNCLDFIIREKIPESKFLASIQKDKTYDFVSRIENDNEYQLKINKLSDGLFNLQKTSKNFTKFINSIYV